MKIANGRWLSVPSIDPQWVGVSMMELEAMRRSAQPGANRALDDINARAHHALNIEIQAKKPAKNNKLRFLNHGTTVADLEREDINFHRYADTADRRAMTGGALPFLGGEVPDLMELTRDSPQAPPERGQPSDDDLME